MSTRSPAPILLFAAALVGCGEGFSSPGGPVEPPTPTPAAEIVANGALSFGLCTGPAGGCFYTQQYLNTGPGCANNLHGKIRVYDEETLLETADWWLDSTLLVGPGETFRVEDCCFDPDSVRLRNRTATETFWNNVPCS